jgi:hypothetical protein
MNPFAQRTDELALHVIRSFGEAGLAGVDLPLQARSDRALAVYRNNFASLVDEQLRAMFCPENYADLKLCAHTSSNVLERVVRETTVLYCEPATRYLKNEADERGRRATAGGRIGALLALPDLELLEAEPDELAAEDLEVNAAGAGEEPTEEPPSEAAPEKPEEAELTPFDRWLAAYDLDSLWAEVHRLARFQPVVWIKPEVREGEDGAQRLTYDVYTPAAAGVITSPKDKTQAIAWFTWRDEPKTGVIADVKTLVTGGKVEMVRVWHVWTRDTYYQLDQRGKDVRPPQVNQLKRLPVVTVRLGLPTDSYYLDGIGGDLYDATLEVCTLRSIENRAFRDSSFKQPVISGVDPEKVPAGQVMGNPALPIFLGEGENTADVLDFAPDLAKLSAMVQEREQSIATKYGISPDAWRRSAAPTSGYAKRLDQGRILAMNREDRKYLAAGEADLYRLCALVSQQKTADGQPTSGLPGIGQLDPAAPFVVDFAEPAFDEEPLAAIRTEAQECQLGVTSVLDVVMKRNPDLTEEEAIQLLARNRLVNERFLSKKGMALMELLAMPAAGTSSAVANQAKGDATPTANAGGPPGGAGPAAGGDA